MTHGTRYPEIFAALAAEFVGQEIRTRTLGNRPISYVTARTVMNRLDTVLGPENWRDEYTPLQNGVLCRLTIRLPDGEEICKSDAGGNAGMSDEGDDEKSGFSDAFKRAAVKWGIGRHLYGEGVPRYDGNREVGNRESGAVQPSPSDSREQPSPRTGRDFYAWVQGQPKDVFNRAAAIAASWGFPSKFVDLDRSEVDALYKELMTKAMAVNFHRNGTAVGNGRHSDGRSPDRPSSPASARGA